MLASEAARQCSEPPSLRLIVDEQHARARCGCGMRGRESRRAAAHDEHVGRRKAQVVAVRIRQFLGETAEAGRPTDRAFKQMPVRAA